MRGPIAAEKDFAVLKNPGSLGSRRRCTRDNLRLGSIRSARSSRTRSSPLIGQTSLVIRGAGEAELIMDASALRGLEGEWRALAESRGNAFLTPEWFFSWHRHYGD